eukprot:7359792-Pyramimonas_sp.AAC.1
MHDGSEVLVNSVLPGRHRDGPEETTKAGHTCFVRHLITITPGVGRPILTNTFLPLEIDLQRHMIRLLGTEVQIITSLDERDRAHEGLAATNVVDSMFVPLFTYEGVAVGVGDLGIHDMEVVVRHTRMQRGSCGVLVLNKPLSPNPM